MTVKLGICNFCVPGTGIFAPRFVAEAGLDGMSIEYGSRAKGFPLAARRLQDAYLDAQQEVGIEYPNIGLSDFDNVCMHAAKGDPMREEGRKMFAGAISAARHMKIPLVFAPSFNASEIRDDAELERTAEAFQYACDLAAEAGVVVATENMLTMARQRALVQAVDRPNFRLFYDSNNLFFFMGVDQVQALRDTYDLFAPQLHVKDGKKGQLGAALLGTGDANFKGVMRELGARRYQGWLILENAYEQPPLRDSREDVFALFVEDVAILTNAVREVGLR